MDITDRRFTFWMHLLFWVGYFLLNGAFYSKFAGLSTVLLKIFIVAIFHMAIVYINLLVLLPALFFNKKFKAYMATMTPLFLATVGGIVVTEAYWLPKRHNVYETMTSEHVVSSLISTFIVLTITALLRFLQEWYRQHEKNRQLAFNKLQAEYRMLKLQVSPHFLFNALNNIYMLAYKKSDAAAPAILKLSDLMRYLLYESDDEKIALRKEIDHIENYIGLQKLKIEKPDEKIRFQTEVADDPYIIPLLLIPFVENAFKHGNLADDGSYVHIGLKTKDGYLSFEVTNTHDPDDESRDESGGVGISNVQSRLEAYYQGKYRLNFGETENNEYRVKLEIDLR